MYSSFSPSTIIPTRSCGRLGAAACAPVATPISERSMTPNILSDMRFFVFFAFAPIRC